MSLAQSLLPELDHETAGTRKVLERVPVPGLYGPSADEA